MADGGSAEAAGLVDAARERDAWKRRALEAEKEIARLKALVDTVERQGKRQAAPFRRAQRKKEPGRPGRKPGHVAANRPVPTHVDHVVNVPLHDCPDCHGEVTDKRTLKPQYVLDPPPDIRVPVTQYNMVSGWCGHCHRRVRSRHPDQVSGALGAAGVQLGARALALAVELKRNIGIPFRKVVGVLALMTGLRVCAGALARAERRITRRCEPTYRALVETVVRRADVVHADETGWFVVAWERAWLWVFACARPAVTVYVVTPSRGSVVPRAVLGEDFRGDLVVDGWSAYSVLDCSRSQCISHLLRRCASLLEVQQRGAARFPWAVKRLLKAALERHRRGVDLADHGFLVRRGQLRAQFARLIDGNIREPANHRFAEHLRRHRDEVLRFLDRPGIPPDNNMGEREVRPAVIVRKLSAGNRTTAGAHHHEVLTTIARTAARNGHSLADVLPPVLRDPDRTRTLALVPQLPAHYPEAHDPAAA